MEIVENKLACGSFGDADRCSWDWVQVAMGFVPEICFSLMFKFKRFKLQWDSCLKYVFD